MAIRKFSILVIRGLVAGACVVGIVILIRLFGVESFQISTNAMAETLRKGDRILVDKLMGGRTPGRNRVVLFTSPLAKDSTDAPLFISRCIGMPGDTILVDESGYTINGRKIPRSPQSLSTYFATTGTYETLEASARKLNITPRDLQPGRFGYTFTLTAFEEYQLREELSDAENQHFVSERIREYRLIVPKKGRAYPLDAAALTACKEIILDETDGKARFRNEKLYIDGRETNFFFFRQDYYWMLSDNADEAIDSRHLGLIPADHIVGEARFRWYSPDKRRIFKPVN